MGSDLSLAQADLFQTMRQMWASVRVKDLLGFQLLLRWALRKMKVGSHVMEEIGSGWTIVDTINCFHLPVSTRPRLGRMNHSPRQETLFLQEHLHTTRMLDSSNCLPGLCRSRFTLKATNMNISIIHIYVKSQLLLLLILNLPSISIKKKLIQLRLPRYVQ